MFPRGLPGLALFFLRMSAALALLLNCYVNRSELSGWILPGAILISLSLCIGLFTPICAAIALALHAFTWSHLDQVSVVAVIVIWLDLLALALIGPGAYSIDGYRFGRRVLVLPQP